jgi:hypothetical protein
LCIRFTISVHIAAEMCRTDAFIIKTHSLGALAAQRLRTSPP